MNLITIAKLDEWDACYRGEWEKYSDRRLKRMLRGRPGWTPLQVARSRSVSVEDRVWVLLRPEVLRAEFGAVVCQLIDPFVETYVVGSDEAEMVVWGKKWLAGEMGAREDADAMAHEFFAPGTPPPRGIHSGWRLSSAWQVVRAAVSGAEALRDEAEGRWLGAAISAYDAADKLGLAASEGFSLSPPDREHKRQLAILRRALHRLEG